VLGVRFCRAGPKSYSAERRGDYEDADDLDDGAAIQRWTTVVTHPDELGWLREALQLLACGDHDEEDDLDQAPATTSKARDQPWVSSPLRSSAARIWLSHSVPS
jgi:hypothetical protein